MFRAIPVSNKICFDKQVKRNWRIHEQKLSQMKSKLSKEKSQEFTFLQQTKKRNTIKDIQNRQIQRSNNILFKKIQSIETKGNKISYLQVDKERSPKNFNRTLHEPFRKRELFRIVEENQQMLRRIKEKKSAYNVRKMEQERRNVEKNISLISEFKYKDYPATQTKVNFYVKEEKQVLQGSRGTHRRENSSVDASKCEPQCQTTTKGKVRGYRHSYFSQTSRFLNNSHYIITTYLNKNVFYIEVQNLENQLDKYRMQINQPQLEKLLCSFYHNRLENLVDNLEIDADSQSCYLQLKKDLEQHSKENQF